MTTTATLLVAAAQTEGVTVVVVAGVQVATKAAQAEDYREVTQGDIQDRTEPAVIQQDLQMFRPPMALVRLDRL
jgi:thiamine pyrophosphate-dependent acetolactate synthase large subunit-like protein